MCRTGKYLHLHAPQALSNVPILQCDFEFLIDIRMFVQGIHNAMCEFIQTTVFPSKRAGLYQPGWEATCGDTPFSEYRVLRGSVERIRRLQRQHRKSQNRTWVELGKGAGS